MALPAMTAGTDGVSAATFGPYEATRGGTAQILDNMRGP